MKTFLLIIGTAFWGLALILLLRRLSVLFRGISVSGYVIDYEVRETISNEGLDYFPVIEFSDSHGNVQRFTSMTGSSSKHPEVGIQVNVRYLESNPKVAYIQSFVQMWAAPLACVVLGLVAFAAFWQV